MTHRVECLVCGMRTVKTYHPSGELSPQNVAAEGFSRCARCGGVMVKAQNKHTAKRDRRAAAEIAEQSA